VANPSLTLRIRRAKRNDHNRRLGDLAERMDAMIWRTFYSKLRDRRLAIARAMAWALILAGGLALAASALGC
jgi:hypothetical protein